MGNFMNEEVYICTVDTVDFIINEPRTDPGPKWYDHKSNSAGLKYEFAIAMNLNRIISAH